MDKNLNSVNKMKIKRTIENLSKNNMSGYLVEDENELYKLIEKIVGKKGVVSVGGSMTLFETEIIDYLRKSDYKFLDRYKDGLTTEDIKDIYIQSFSADAYFVSTNAITEAGELYNVDGRGNRVAAMLFGPDKVIIVAGVNKIVKNIDEAINRNKSISGPANTKRLDFKTPCNELGYCVDCGHNQRICNKYTIIKKEVVKDRMHVIFLNENYGY